MSKKILTVQKVIMLMYQYLFAVLAMILISALFRARYANAAELIVLFCMFFISMIIRDKAFNYLILLAVHFLMELFIFILGFFKLFSFLYFGKDGVYIEWVSIIAVSVTFFDAVRYMKQGCKIVQLFDVPWPTLVLAIFVTSIGTYMKNSYVVKIGYIIPTVLFFLYLTLIYIDGLKNYLETSKDFTGIPIGRIVSVNTLIVTGIMIAMFAVISLAYLLNLQILFVQLGKAAVAVLRAVIILIGIIASIIAGFFKNGTVNDETQSFENIKQTLENANPVASGVDFFLKAGFIVIVLFVIYRLIRKILKFLLTRKIIPDDKISTEYISLNKNENEEKTPRIHVTENGSAAMRARHIYRKRVIRYKKFYKPAASATAGDIKSNLKMIEDNLEDYSRNVKREKNMYNTKSEEKFNFMTELYEKVRYGGYEPSDSELKRMKEE